ncbi:DUF2334 domain-containing protein [Paenibacillus sp. S-38]|uniref:DUF2334 domain-containing protein n=1 Tax=Paenibacillus sp. S-38 TaxID=3416710 RepID=UPI003CE718DC
MEEHLVARVRTQLSKHHPFFLAAALLLLSAGIAAGSLYGSTPMSHIGKKQALLRLEDVGPGGAYAGAEDLGRLRAVLQELKAQHVPFSIAVIPHWIAVQGDGSLYDKEIGREGAEPYLHQFVQVLQSAQRDGAALGMHGYSHQYGTVPRGDGGQTTGIGREFKVEGAPESDEPSYAEARIDSSLRAFEAAGLLPRFWESPHYQDTRAQEEVFRSRIGLLYEPDFFSLRSLRDSQVYESENTYGEQPTLGSVYVPAPLKYIHEGRTVEQLLEQSEDYSGLASLYFHPMLEFPYLEPVLTPDGTQAAEDGLPLYRYKPGESPLHKLVSGLRAQGYRWLSLAEAVPFTPAHRVALPGADKPKQVLYGDVRGAGHADPVIVRGERVEVIEGRYTGPRSDTQPAPRAWLQGSFADGDRLWLDDTDGDGRQDLLHYRSLDGAVLVYRSGGQGFSSAAPYAQLPTGLREVISYHPKRPERDGRWGPFFIASGQGRLSVWEGSSPPVETAGLPLPEDAEWLAVRPSEGGGAGIAVRSAAGVLLYPDDGQGSLGPAVSLAALPAASRGSELLGMDADGDGDTDLTLYEPEAGAWQVYRNEGDFRFAAMPNGYGPWASGAGRTGAAADFDGNGKEDLVSYDGRRQVLDLSLSYQETPAGKDGARK